MAHFQNSPNCRLNDPLSPLPIVLLLLLLLLLPRCALGDTDSSCSYCASEGVPFWGNGPCNSGDVMLQSSYIKVGIHLEGSYGTYRSSPSASTRQPSCPVTFAPYEGKQLGFVADFGRDGWAQGTPLYAGDYFIPGSPVEGWLTTFNINNGGAGTSHAFCNKGLIGSSQCGTPVPTSSMDITSDGSGNNGKQSALWIGTAQSTLQISKVTQFDGYNLYFTTVVTMKNTGQYPLRDVYYMRTVDPDQEWAHTASVFSTLNWVEYQRYEDGDPDGRASTETPNLCLVSSKGHTYSDLFLGLGSVNPHCRVGHYGFHNNEPSDLWGDVNSQWTSYSSSDPRSFDEAIQLGYHYETINPGESVQFKFAYVLNSDDIGSALAALESVSITAPGALVSGDDVLFQCSLDENAGDCKTTYAGNPQCEIDNVKFYLYTSSIGFALLSTTTGVNDPLTYTYQTYFDASSYVVGAADTPAQLKVVVTMLDGSTYDQVQSVTLAPQSINMCWDLDNNGTPDTLSDGYIYEIDNGAGFAFQLVVCDSSVDDITTVEKVRFMLQITDGSADSGEVLLYEDSQATSGGEYGVDIMEGRFSQVSAGGSVTGVLSAQTIMNSGNVVVTSLQFVAYHAPTSAPSAAPSEVPTETPSRAPSTPPTAIPSASPTVAPSTAPSASPSAAPSEAPSSAPSLQPSEAPSAAPSASPSAAPSAAPSTAPSAVPSSAPTSAPSTSPSSAPSTSPSSAPSLAPSTSPSSAPSSAPSTSPSSHPSARPSSYPSAAPSLAPSIFPREPCNVLGMFETRLHPSERCCDRINNIADNAIKNVQSASVRVLSEPTSPENLFVCTKDCGLAVYEALATIETVGTIAVGSADDFEDACIFIGATTGSPSSAPSETPAYCGILGMFETEILVGPACCDEINLILGQIIGGDSAADFADKNVCEQSICNEALEIALRHAEMASTISSGSLASFKDECVALDYQTANPSPAPSEQPFQCDVLSVGTTSTTIGSSCCDSINGIIFKTISGADIDLSVAEDVCAGICNIALLEAFDMVDYGFDDVMAFQQSCIDSNFATDMPTFPPSLSPTSAPSKGTPSPTTLTDRREMEASYNCDCDTCTYYYLEPTCTSDIVHEYVYVYVNKTVHGCEDDTDDSKVGLIVADNTTQAEENFSFTTVAGMFVLALLLGVCGGKVFLSDGGKKKDSVEPVEGPRYCIATTNTGQPCLYLAVGDSDYCALHAKNADMQSEEDAANKLGEENVRGRERAMSVEDAQTLEGITKFMTPTKNTKGATRLRRVVRERLTKLQAEEKSKLLATIAEANRKLDLELAGVEADEMKRLEEEKHDHELDQNLEKIHRQNVNFVKIRCIHKARLLRAQLYDRQKANEKERVLSLWQNESTANQTTITAAVKTLHEEQEKELSLLDEKCEEESRSLVSAVVPYDHSEISRVMDLCQEVDKKAKDDLHDLINEVEVSRREDLRRATAAIKSARAIELAKKGAPANEVKQVNKSVDLVARASTSALEASLLNTRNMILNFEDFMASFRGHYNDEFEAEHLRLLQKREVVAIKTFIQNRSLRLGAKRKEEAVGKKWEKKLEHGMNKTPADEVASDLAAVDELMEAESLRSSAGLEKELQELLQVESARQNRMQVDDHFSLFDELVVLKAKHDADLRALWGELKTDYSKTRQELEGNAMRVKDAMMRSNSSQNFLEGFDHEKDKLYSELEMRMKSSMDRAHQLEISRQFLAEGMGEDYESMLANLKKSHEKEIGLLADTLYSEQRRQRARMLARLEERKKRRRLEMKESGSSEGEISTAMEILDAEYGEDEAAFLARKGREIDERIKNMRDHFAEEEKKVGEFNSMMEHIKSEHEAGLVDMKRNLEADRKRQKDLLEMRLAAKRAQRESSKGGMSLASQELLEKEEEDARREFNVHADAEAAKLAEKAQGQLASELSQARTEESVSGGMFRDMHDDIERIRREHDAGILALEQDLELQQASRRKKLQDRIKKRRHDLELRLIEEGAGEAESKAQREAFMQEVREEEDEMERSFIQEEAKAVEALVKYSAAERSQGLKTAEAVAKEQQRQQEEAKRIREDHAAAEKQLEMEMKGLRVKSEGKLKERLEAKRKKRMKMLAAKGAGEEEKRAVEAALLEDEVDERTKLEAELADVKSELVMLKNQQNAKKLQEMVEEEDREAQRQAAEAERLRLEALEELEKLKKENEENSRRAALEIAENQDAQKNKLKLRLAKRRKLKEKELDKKRVSEAERMAAEKAMREEEERLQRELEEKMEKEAVELEEKRKAEEAAKEEEIQKLAQAAAAEAKASVARQRVQQAAKDARLAAEKEARDAAEEAEKDAAEKETKRLLAKFEEDQKRLRKETSAEKDRQKVLLKKRLKLKKEQAERRRAEKMRLKDMGKEKIQGMVEMHSKQIGELGNHMSTEFGGGGGGGTGGPMSSEESEHMKTELEALKEELAQTKVILEKEEERREEAVHINDGLEEELAGRVELLNKELADARSDALSARSNLSEAASKIVSLQMKLDDSDTISAADAKVLRDDYEEAKKLELEAKAGLDEAVFARGELAEEKAKCEERIKELGGVVEGLEEKLEGNERETKETVRKLEEEREEAVSEARGEAQKVIDKLEEEMGELKVVANRVVEAEEKEKIAKELREKYERQYKVEIGLRKRYWNMLEDAKGKVRVYARIRPLSVKELELEEEDGHSKVDLVDETKVRLMMNFGEKGENAREEEKVFEYNSCFGPLSTQQDIFDECSGLVLSCLDGYSACVFAYGQTGAGKTWTMTGGNDKKDWGLTRRFINYLYDEINDNKASSDVTVSCDFFEIYCGTLKDLFYHLDHPKDKNPPKLTVGLDAKHKVVVKGALTKGEEDFKGPEEMLALFDKANKGRVVAHTAMNSQSSRSHSIFVIKTHTYNKTTKKSYDGKLNIIDLAGSERINKSKVEGQQKEEAIAINESLSCLGNVISVLSSEEYAKKKGDVFVPYRENILTKVMQDSLGGDAKTLMFVNCSPAKYNLSETFTSLTYASRVKNITNIVATKDEDSAEVTRLKRLLKSHGIKDDA